MLSYLSSLPISVLCSLDTVANKFYDKFYDRTDCSALLTRYYTKHALRPVIDSKINHIRHFIKIPVINKGMHFLVNRVFSEINLYNQPYQIISRIAKYQLFVLNIIKILGALYLVSINLFLVLISKLVPLTSEIARILNMFIRLRVMLSRAI